MSEPLPIADLIVSETPPVRWLIPGIIPEGYLIALAGEPGTGKSFTCYTLSLALATGTPFLGIPLTPRRVLYFDQENSMPDCIEYHKRAWHGLDCPDRELIAKNYFFYHFHLGGPHWVRNAAEAIQAVEPALIIIDTTTPCCHIQDENDNAEATRVINAIRSIQGPATVVALKHAKLHTEGDARYTLRGAKAWEGAVDSILFQLRSEGRPRQDGLCVTRIMPQKVRAFGLSSTIKVEPSWCHDNKGIRLSRAREQPR